MSGDVIQCGGKEWKVEEINLCDLKTLYEKRVTPGQATNKRRWKGGLNSYSNPKKKF